MIPQSRKRPLHQEQKRLSDKQSLALKTKLSTSHNPLRAGMFKEQRTQSTRL